MALPKVTINVNNGALGAIAPIADGVCGMIMTAAVKPANLNLATAVKITSLAAAVALGITAAWGTTNNSHAYDQIAQFYDAAGTGAELWIMIVIDTETITNICDSASTNHYAKNLIDAADGEIRILGVTRKPVSGFSGTVLKGFDDDAYAAITKLQALANDYAALYKPFVGIIDGRNYQGVPASLEDLRDASWNNVAVVLAGTGTLTKSASVGLLLGCLAAQPVQRNIARVKNGALPITTAELTDDAALPAEADLATIHDKGYIVIRTYAGKTGYYWSDDPTATALTDDYSSIARRRVINKVLQIAYQTYVDELNEEIEIDADGKMNPAIVKALQAKIENAINLDMTAEAEISGCRAVIDPTQNVLSTSKVEVDLYITPVGYAKEIEVNIGFENPSL